MLKMMIAFFKGYFQYRKEVKKQHRWITKYAKQKNYAVNPNWMVSTNLKIWLSEMQATFGKRYCPCFEPSADPKLNKKMMCPCEYIDDEIEEYGTCHCALFGPSDLDKEGWKASSARLMKEYRVPLNFKNGVLDTRGMPLDPRRHLPIPDVMHQLKSTLAGYSESKLKIIVQTEQEASNIETIADYRGYGVWRDKKEDHIEVILELNDAAGRGTNTSCGDVIQPDTFSKNNTGDIRLTQYSHGTGCECKIAPKQLESILRSARETIRYPELLVGNDTNDDAAAFDLGNGTSVLSTTDFFMPIVDDPFTFGKIAACNAISDIYAMGGKPLMAISIFGWPIDKLSDEVAREVIEGGRAVCEEASIPLAGGHSIDSPEPIFGLAVTGIVDNAYLKRNDSTEPGCELFITKPIGIGILTTAQKQGKIAPGDIDPAVEAMTTLNKVGAAISQLEGVTAVTDVTGFGLLGHLAEMCENSGIGAVVRYEDVPLLPKVHEYLAMDCVPGGTRRNFQSYGHKIGLMNAEQQVILCDSQTSGGLLCAVRKNAVDSFLELTASEGLSLKSIGETVERGDNLIDVI